MKVIVQIPCFNEEGTLGATIGDIPRDIEGVSALQVLVIDDGSSDATSAVARAAGADHVIRFARNRGLGQAFRSGLDESLALGADIIVNTDGDNQYFGGDIARLVAPILAGEADLVIGDRRPGEIAHFSRLKRFLQRFGSRMISRLANTEVPDVASGFRAYSRAAALQLSTVTDFDHTAEQVVQAGRKRLAIVSVPVRTNPKLRESRLFEHPGHFVTKSALIALRTYVRYRALRVFSWFGMITFGAGLLLGVRFLYFFLFSDEGHLHVQSVILAGVLLLAGFQMVLIGIVADLIATNRTLLEETVARLRGLDARNRSEE